MARASLGPATLSGALVLLAAAHVSAAPAQSADPDPQTGPLQPVMSDDDPRDEFAAFPLVVPHEKHYVRAGAEVGAVVVVGFVDYLLNTAARGGVTRQGDARWDLRYDWSDLRGKLVGTAYELDANRFATNYASHPFAGTLYYQVARSSHLSIAESFLFAVLGSSLWEYFGEIREHVSINDMIVTPVSGLAIGEPMMQLSAFFDRGRDNTSNRILSAIFSPVKAINDLFDEPQHLRTTHPDALGFATEPWHRFEVYGRGGFTVQEATRSSSGLFPQATSPDVGFGVGLSVANLPGYDGAGRHARLFDDGNVSSLSFDAVFSRGDLASAVFATRLLPVGYYFREATVDEKGDVSGHGAILAMRAGFEYGAHDYDRDRARPKDLIAIVSPVGIAAEHTFDHGGWRVRTAVDVAGSIAGVQAYALSDFRAQHPVDGLGTALRTDGYYHAFGVTASPSISVRYRALEWNGTMRFDTFRAIEGLDEAEEKVDRSISVDDRRTTLRTSLAWRPQTAPWRLSVETQHATRTGYVGPVHAGRSESSVHGTFGLVF